MMSDNEIGELIRLMSTLDGRDFLYNFFLKSCGVDFSVGFPTGHKSEYETGRQKAAIDFLNLIIYHCPEHFKTMLNEQKRRS